MSEKPKKLRIHSIDSLRGLVMVIMVLDHVRTLLYTSPYYPLDIAHAGTALFMTRWVTHFCAPVFVLLSGSSAFLSVHNGRSKRDMSLHLLSRGAILILLELLYISPLWGVPSHYYVLQVLWAIGISMFVLAAALHFPGKLRWALGIALVLFHNLLDPFDAILQAKHGLVWTLLHAPGTFSAFGATVQVVYPLLPWIGVMLLGYQLGELLVQQKDVLSRKLLLSGGALTASFFLLRLANFYGDPSPWSLQNSLERSILSFINCEKYPPSLLFLLMTIGPALLLLFLLQRRENFFTRILGTFGRVPLFFYLIHLPMIYFVSQIAAASEGPVQLFRFQYQTPDLRAVYLIWVLCCIFLYFPCKLYGRFRKSAKQTSG